MPTTTSAARTVAGGETNTRAGDLAGSGRVTAYTPGSDIIILRREASTVSVKCFYTKSTRLMDPDGRTLDWTALKPDMLVTYRYVKEVDRMVLTRVMLAARLSVEKRESEIITTTKP